MYTYYMYNDKCVFIHNSVYDSLYIYRNMMLVGLLLLRNIYYCDKCIDACILKNGTYVMKTNFHLFGSIK